MPKVFKKVPKKKLQELFPKEENNDKRSSKTKEEKRARPSSDNEGSGENC